MISGSIVQEFEIFLKVALLGAALMLFYDVLRIFRRLIPRGIVLVSVEDVLYWLFFGLAVFILLYRENDGTVRGFIVGGTALGLILYYVLLGRWLMPRISRIIYGMKKRLKKAGRNVRMKLKHAKRTDEDADRE